MTRHAEDLAKLGWQYFECPACGSEGSRAFPKPEQEPQAYREAAQLAKWLFKKHYAQEEHYASGRVVWGLCDTTAGVISQIDNMVCKLVLPKEPEQEPVAWEQFYPEMGKPKLAYLPPTESPDNACYTPPQRKPLTDEEIMANDVLRYHFALNGGAGPISKQGRKVIDAIEAAHGIKGEA